MTGGSHRARRAAQAPLARHGGPALLGRRWAAWRWGPPGRGSRARPPWPRSPPGDGDSAPGGQEIGAVTAGIYIDVEP